MKLSRTESVICKVYNKQLTKLNRSVFVCEQLSPFTLAPLFCLATQVIVLPNEVGVVVNCSARFVPFGTYKTSSHFQRSKQWDAAYSIAWLSKSKRKWCTRENVAINKVIVCYARSVSSIWLVPNKIPALKRFNFAHIVYRQTDFEPDNDVTKEKRSPSP